MIPDSRIPAFFAWLVAWCAVSFFLFHGHMDLPPVGQHAWAMSDYFAMALRYGENGFDFFHPQTYNLQTVDGITAADLPLPAWGGGVIMAIFHVENGLVFRFLTWIVTTIGLGFFFQTLREGGVSARRSVVLTLFWGVLSGWVYYQISMLPSPVALSAFLAGFWGLSRVVRRVNEEGTFRTAEWAWAVAGMTLAALIRKPFILYDFALILVLWNFKLPRKAWIGWAAGMTLFGFWQLYDDHLATKYGSSFLRTFMPAESLQEVRELFVSIWNKWGLDWFSPFHLLWMLLIPGLLVYNRRWTKTATLISVGVWGIAVFYFALMMRQFADHEYYVLDSFYPAALVCAAFWAMKADWDRRLFWVELILLAGGIWSASQKLQWYWWYSHTGTSEKTYRVYHDGRPLLDQLKVPADAKMLVFEAYSDNLPLVGMRRTGYCLKTSNAAEQEKKLALHPDYAVCLDSVWVGEVVSANPEVVKQLTYVGGNMELLVFRPGNYPDNTLENLLFSRWEMLTDTTVTSLDQEFLLAKTIPRGTDKGLKICFYGKISLDQPGEIKATVALFKGGQKVTLDERSLRMDKGGILQFRSADIRLPDVPADEIRVYLWNPDHRKAGFEHFRISVGVSKNK
jgi:hypothetical protein